MNARGWIPIAAITAACAAMPAPAAVFKCRGADGTLTYQQIPCGGADQVTMPSDIASEYPAPNTLERERLLTREAELDKRLEAQRDRLSAEAIASLSRPEPVVMAADPAYAIAWPGRYARPLLRRLPMHGWSWAR